MNDKKSGTILIILGYVFAILGGYFSIVCGLSLITQKKKDENGNKEYLYKESSRTHGWIIFVLGVIMCFVASFYIAKEEKEEKEKKEKEQAEQFLEFITKEDVAGLISIRDIPKTIYASDSSFSIELPSNFINEVKSDKNVDMYCYVLDSIEMTVTVSRDNPFDVFSSEWTYGHDTKIIPLHIKGFETYSTWKKFDKDKKIVYYERRDLKDNLKDVYFFAYQIGGDRRNYLISTQSKASYGWSLEKFEKIASSLKTF